MPRTMRSLPALLCCFGLVVLTAGPVAAAAQDAADDPLACTPGGDPVGGRVEISPADTGTYQLRPFEVAAGTTRVEVSYDWGSASLLGDTPLTATTVDLGVWDADGYRSADGFRGWAGSRHRQVSIAVDEATRTMKAGPIEAGTWWVEFGIAAVAPDGGWYEYEVVCRDPAVGPAPTHDPVDPDHVADPEPGWYHGDFHMHGHHSHPDAPTYDVFVDFARSQGLDFFPLTEYVTDVHWGQLGPFQRANPDVLFWPGREIITYEGHVTQFGATPGAIEYRHGFEDIAIDDILADARAGGALLGLAHPTTFEQPGFESFCRGCAWELEDVAGWDPFTTIEVAQGPQVVRLDPALPGFENPFTHTAIRLWEDLLERGVLLTAVGASDDKLSGQATGPFATPHGVPATAVHADELSVAALTRAVQAGHAYVRTRGVAASPAVEVEAVAADGTRGMMGDTLVTGSAEVTVTVTGGADQFLRVFRDRSLVDLRPILDDEFTHTFTLTRDEHPASPLGTWVRFETFDLQGRTTITNPVFLAHAPDVPDPTGPAPAPTRTPVPAASDPVQAAPDRPATPTTGGGAAPLALLALLAGANLTRRRPRSRPCA